MNDTMSDRRSNALRKIRALIAKADDRSVTAEEAESFRAKADELMTKFAVEEWEAMQIGPTSITPELRDVDMTWWIDQAIDDQEAQEDLFGLWYWTYKHARCIPVSGTTNYGSKTRKIAGFPADLDYADLLFTSLQFQLVEAINPQPDPNLGLMENYYRLHGAGLQHDEVFYRLLKAGLVPDYAGPHKPGRDGWAAFHGNILKRYRAWCDATGNRKYINYKTYRRSFSQGFVNRVVSRLDALRRDQNEQTTASGSQYALVLRDIQAMVQEFVYEQYPDLRPRPVVASPPMDTVKRGRRVAKPKEKSIDWKAVQMGMDAGDKANLNMHPGRRVNRNVAGELEE